MKSTINPAALSKELKKFNLVIKKNTVLPILSTILFKFDKNKLTLTATDLETTYVTVMDCECPKPFSLVIEYTDILDICNSVAAPIELSTDENGIYLVSGKAKFKLSLSGQPTDFPLVPDEDFNFEMNVDGDFFYHLSNANTCRNKEDLKVNMNMVAIDIAKDKMELIGVDGFMMYKKTIPKKSKKELSVMVTDKFVQICKLFQDTKISIGEKFIKAEYKDEIIISRLSEAKFVAYRNILPAELVINLTIDKAELNSELNAISVASNLTTKQCVLNFSEGKIKLTTQNIDFGKEAETEIDVEHKVEIDAVCLNSTMLTHLLNLLTTEQVEMSVTSQKSATYIQPSGDNSILCLLMPLMINP